MRALKQCLSKLVLLLLAAFPLLAGDAQAQDQQPDALQITHVEPSLSRVLTFEALQQLPFVEIATTTPWTDGVQLFRGVPLASILDLKSEDRKLHMRAANDYFITMPAEEVSDDYPIIAYMRNGAPMSVRDKGRYWVVYPFDQEPRFNDETHLSRSIWQLVEISIMR